MEVLEVYVVYAFLGKQFLCHILLVVLDVLGLWFLGEGVLVYLIRIERYVLDQRLSSLDFGGELYLDFSGGIEVVTSSFVGFLGFCFSLNLF